MKPRRLLLALGSVILLVLLLAGGASAKATKVWFTCTETQIGGSEPLKYWEAGQTAHIRGVTSVYQELCSEDSISGTNTVTVDLDFHPVVGGMAGEFRGTYTLENTGGYWTGTFHGSIAADGTSTYEAHGKGAEEYAGLQVHLFALQMPGQPTTATGYIFDPGR